MKNILLFSLTLLILAGGVWAWTTTNPAADAKPKDVLVNPVLYADPGLKQPLEKERSGFEVQHSDAEWKTLLSGSEFKILRRQGTEPPFFNKYHNHKGQGVYQCAGCNQVLFTSDQKYDSKTGWPSFWDAAEEGRIRYRKDDLLGWTRVEMICSRCGGHIGHVFTDGPKPTGLRYCANSEALAFEKKASLKAKE
ncbi:MAG: peptide-methionine (R)-S-oxide reductase MsrB [Vampirovibrio sp.]|nr:peptide-methionine (R)-S-oxide reductase MsrB [Vampirovibrio sp.]